MAAENTFNDHQQEEALALSLSPGAVILGMGNTLRGDDGFGPALVKAIDPTPGLHCMDAGPAPENFLGRVAYFAPHDVVIADAVHLNAAPGAWRVLDANDVASVGVTTHDIPVHMLMEYLVDLCGARVRMLAVQPAQLGLGMALSPVVRLTTRRLAMLIRRSSLTHATA